MNYPHKESKYCGSEVQILVKVLLDNVYLLTVSEDEVFDKMAEALNGKRNKDQVRLWWYNLKKIFHEEKRFTKVVENYVMDEQKNKLKEVITGVKSSPPMARGPPERTDSPVDVKPSVDILRSEEESAMGNMELEEKDRETGGGLKEKAMQGREQRNRRLVPSTSTSTLLEKGKDEDRCRSRRDETTESGR